MKEREKKKKTRESVQTTPGEQLKKKRGQPTGGDWGKKKSQGGEAGKLNAQGGGAWVKGALQVWTRGGGVQKK